MSEANLGYMSSMIPWVILCDPVLPSLQNKQTNNQSTRNLIPSSLGWHDSMFPGAVFWNNGPILHQKAPRPWEMTRLLVTRATRVSGSGASEGHKYIGHKMAKTTKLGHPGPTQLQVACSLPPRWTWLSDIDQASLELSSAPCLGSLLMRLQVCITSTAEFNACLLFHFACLRQGLHSVV